MKNGTMKKCEVEYAIHDPHSLNLYTTSGWCSCRGHVSYEYTQRNTVT